MSESNKAIVRRMVEECQSAGDLSLVDEFFSPALVNYAPSTGLLTDRDGLRMRLGAFHDAFAGFHVVIKDQLAEGDKVVTLKTLKGTHRGEFAGVPATGKTVSFDVMDILRLEDGKIVEDWYVADLLGLMQQLGAVTAR